MGVKDRGIYPLSRQGPVKAMMYNVRALMIYEVQKHTHAVAVRSKGGGGSLKKDGGCYQCWFKSFKRTQGWAVTWKHTLSLRWHVLSVAWMMTVQGEVDASLAVSLPLPLLLSLVCVCVQLFLCLSFSTRLMLTITFCLFQACSCTIKCNTCPHSYLSRISFVAQNRIYECIGFGSFIL